MHPSRESVEIESWTERGINGRQTKFSIRASGSFLTLHAGNRMWELNDPTLAFRFAPYTTSLTSTFTVLRRGHPEFVFRYLHVGRTFAARIDPTYDALDFTMEHKLCLVAEQALKPQWQSAYLKLRLEGKSEA